MIPLSDLITVQGFSRASKHLFNSRFDASKVQAGDSIYLHDWRIWFERQRVDVPYVLVTNYHDNVVSEFPEKAAGLKKWFAVQVKTDHPQIEAMPVAIKDGRLKFIARQQRDQTRSISLYLNFKQHTPERERLYRRFAEAPWAMCDTYYKINMDRYFDHLARSFFVLSPAGIGEDCYRTWEALAMGAIPIVKRSHLSKLYEGLPVVQVDDWEEITQPFLIDQLEWSRAALKDWRRMSMSYWTERINA